MELNSNAESFDKILETLQIAPTSAGLLITFEGHENFRLIKWESILESIRESLRVHEQKFEDDENSQNIRQR